METLHDKLLYIQTNLKAPKSQHNAFGNYNYRNCEDILNALKPLLKETKCTIELSDDLLYIGDRHYVKSHATLKDGKELITVTAYARECADKKGMDEAQITGAASTYARKYALNGLFAIDDTKDADSHNPQEEKGKKQEPESVIQEVEFEKPPSKSVDCSLCGAVLSKKVHDFSVKVFKQPLCIDCQKQFKK